MKGKKRDEFRKRMKALREEKDEVKPAPVVEKEEPPEEKDSSFFIPPLSLPKEDLSEDSGYHV